MENLGIAINDKLDNSNTNEGLIFHQSSKIKIAAIPVGKKLIVADEVKNFLTINENIFYF
jgi:acetate kinase